ncbi:MAG: branched-chain amino acid ABC transporter permease [Xanthobacteraceae bacterium]|jgi:branched-chain amino acid transport system permease protein
MENWAQQLVNAATIGGMYTLVAVGFTLFFGVLGLINFAHGEVFMLGAFAALVAARILLDAGLSSGWLLVLVMFIFASLFCGIIGVLTERLAYKPVRRSPMLVMLITSLGVSFLMRESVKEFFPDGANPLSFPSPYVSETVHIGAVVINYTQIALIGASLVLVGALYLLVERTWFGKSMRATAEDRDAARMMGVNIDRIIRNAFLLGSALGGIAGVMNGLYYLSIRFDMGWVMAIKGFTAAVLGGLGNIYGAAAGGYALALLEVLIVALVPQGSQYKDVFVFLVLILVLVFRPTGIFGRAPQKLG